jgi:hypothetical protein
MTENRPGGQPRPFGADELDGVSGLRPDELAAETRLARELEGAAARVSVLPSPDFTDRVMAAVALEPAAAPVLAARVALRRGAFGAFLASIRDAWRVTVSPAFPMAMRAQALAMVLLVAGLAAGTGVVTAGAFGLFDADRPSPSIETPEPSVQTAEPQTAEPTEGPASMEPSASPEPSPSLEDESAEPTESEEPTGSEEPTRTDKPNATTSPTKKPSASPIPPPTSMPSPTGTPSHTADPSASPETPKPSRTPRPSDESHSGG